MTFVQKLVFYSQVILLKTGNFLLNVKLLVKNIKSISSSVPTKCKFSHFYHYIFRKQKLSSCQFDCIELYNNSLVGY